MGKKKTKENGKNGVNPSPLRTSSARSTLEFHLTPEQVLKRLATAGLTDADVAQCFGLTPDQLYYLLQQNPSLEEEYHQAKDVPNHQVEGALFRRALGYQVREVHSVEGRPTKVILKEMAPDVVACIFWLKNRMPKQWRDTLEVRHTLRDSMDRAHTALRHGGGVPALGTKDEAMDVEAKELKS